VEDIRVGVRVAEGLLRDLAQRIARLDGVGFLTLRSGLTLLRSRLRAGRADISHDLLLPGRDRFDRVPNLVRFLLRLDCPLEVQFAVAFFRVALHVEILRRLNGVVVLLPKCHVFLLRGMTASKFNSPRRSTDPEGFQLLRTAARLLMTIVRQNVSRNPTCAVRFCPAVRCRYCWLVSIVVIVQFGELKTLNTSALPSSAIRCGSVIFCCTRRSTLRLGGWVNQLRGTIVPSGRARRRLDDSG